MSGTAAVAHASHQDHQKFADALGSIYAKGGLLQQAQEAKLLGDGAFAQFIKQLLAQFGPLLGQLLAGLLGGLIHIPLPIAPVAVPKVAPVEPLTPAVPASPTSPPSNTAGEDPQSQSRQHPSC